MAAIWVLDGLLQYQSYMFTTAFGTQVVAPAAAGNPGWIADSITWAAMIVEHNPVPTNVGFATLQLLIGLALAWRPAVKPALAVSIGWALLVWWFGEGLGGILTGSASAFGGAPGAVLLYAILAVLLWPTAHSTARSFVAARPIGVTGAKIVWLILWGGFALLNLQPANLTAGGLHSMVTDMAAGQPAWITGLMSAFAELSAHNGVVFTIVGTLILALIAAGIFLPPRWARLTVVAAIVTSVFIWLIGQALGAMFGGQGTDPNSGPLLILIAIAYWPAIPTHSRTHPHPHLHLQTVAA